MVSEVQAVGRPVAQDYVLTGPRGIGKTVTLDEFARRCRAQHFEVISVQAAALNATIVTSMFAAAQQQATSSSFWRRASKLLANVATVNAQVAGTGAGVSLHAPSPALVTPESLAGALAAVAAAVSKHHRGRGGLLIMVDELQVGAYRDLALLAATLQTLRRSHRDSRVIFAATGLPNTFDVLVAARVTHPDRLLREQPIPLRLEPDAARLALVKPATDLEVSWHPAAVSDLLTACNCYPAHLQLFADSTWASLPEGTTTITPEHVSVGVRVGVAELEQRTLAPRFNHLSDRQLEFLTAIAYQSGEAPIQHVARALGRQPSDLSRLRDRAITEGDVYSPRRGVVALTLPTLGSYLLRHYDEACERSQVPLATPDTMAERLGADAPRRPL
jgi:hypothetical protein